MLYYEMAKSVAYGDRALRDLRGIDRTQARRIRRRVDRYAENGEGDVVPYQGTDLLRLRVGDYRVLFEESDEQIDVYRVRHRREAYR